MSAHTEGRLTLGKHGIILGGPGRELKKGIAYDQLFMACVTESGDQQENARRLVACWNACEGLPTEALETAPPIAERITIAIAAGDNLDAELAKRTAERDQLRAELAALTSDEATAHDLLVAEIKKTGQLHHEHAAARALLGEVLAMHDANEVAAEDGTFVDFDHLMERIRALLGDKPAPFSMELGALAAANADLQLRLADTTKERDDARERMRKAFAEASSSDSAMERVRALLKGGAAC